MHQLNFLVNDSLSETPTLSADTFRCTLQLHKTRRGVLRIPSRTCLRAQIKHAKGERWQIIKFRKRILVSDIAPRCAVEAETPPFFCLNFYTPRMSAKVPSHHHQVCLSSAINPDGFCEGEIFRGGSSQRLSSVFLPCSHFCYRKFHLIRTQWYLVLYFCCMDL